MSSRWRVAGVGVLLIVLSSLICVALADQMFSDDNCPRTTHYQCDDGVKCIVKSYLCNNVKDCPDNDDEVDCDRKKCIGDYFQCRDNVTCIAKKLECDGVGDCPDNSDESDENCPDTLAVGDEKDAKSTKDDEKRKRPKKKKCKPEKEFQCDDRTCIKMKLVCDGTKQCIDGSDENPEICLEKTKAKNVTCPGFVCDNGQCLSRKTWLCDGFTDCADGSDEKHCKDNCDLAHGDFLCKSDDECLPLSKVCDGHPDCLDKSDEGAACNKTDACESMPCKDNCILLPSGATCLCKPGYTYDAVKNECVDIDECERYGICSQGCVNTAGSYKCTCAPKFRIKRDNKTCEAYGDDPLLVYSTQKRIKTIYLHSRTKDVVAKTRQAIGVTYDGIDFFWTEVSDGREAIVRLAKGITKEIILTAGLEQPEDLAIDWLTGNIYFTDATKNHIAVCNNNGYYCTQLVYSYAMENPRGIVLHPAESLMFWTDWGNNSHIGVAFMDGKYPRVLIDDVHWPNGITLDWPNGRIYWVDAKLQIIESAKITGKDRRVVLQDMVQHPYGIAVFEDRLYWSDWETASIESCNKFTGKDHETLVQGEPIFDVHIYHEVIMPHQKHACDGNACSHICLLSVNSSYTCACPDNMKLLPDLHTCRVSEKAYNIILGIGRYVMSVPQQTFGRHVNSFANIVPFDVDRVEFNSQNGEVFFADSKAGKILIIDLQTHLVFDLVVNHVFSVRSMAYDYLANNLYWIDDVKGTIEVFSLNSKKRAIIQYYAGSEKPTALALVPSSGEMFVALEGEDHYHIDRLSMHGGSKHQHVVETGLSKIGPIHLAVDEEFKLLYWSDGDAREIEFSDFNGMDRKVFAKSKRAPGPMAIIDDELYWTSLKSKTLQWGNKTGEGGIKLVTMDKPPGAATMPNLIDISAGAPLKTKKHACMISNGGCSDICISDGESSRVCLCETGHVFKDHYNVSCVSRLNCGFRCSSGECLELSQKCDKKVDCQDKSDEPDNCDKVKSVHCDATQFMCRENLKCIPMSQRCDMNYNCDDHSDEANCSDDDKRSHCRSGQLKCPKGLCIDVTQMCDGVDDCGDGYDEICESVTCPKDFFQCLSGQCIPQEFECNAAIDCKDGSDEHAECKMQICKPHMKACPGGWCINEKLFCDGHEDCEDGYDEVGCPGWNEKAANATCDLDEFQCSDPFKCLPASKVCDGEANCPKGEDERGCSICSVGWFECANHNCIPRAWVCDGNDDCEDLSDENNCTNIKTPSFFRTCAHDEFKCNDGLCLSYDRVCDGRKDCRAGDDEGGACETSCKGEPCDQKCLKTPKGAVCDCKEGYHLASAGDKKCSDIDECKEHDPCSQDCTNIVGSFRCSCHDGFMMANDRVSCKALGSPQKLLFTLSDEVRQLTISPRSLDVLIDTNDFPIADIAVDMQQQKLLLMAQLSDELIGIDLKSGDKEIFEGVPVSTRMAHDWISGNTYIVHYPEDNTVEIHVCSLKSKNCARISKLGYQDQIPALAVDPINRFIFYVQLHNVIFLEPTSRIIKARLDGSDPRIIANDSHVLSLALDIEKRQVYFTEFTRLALHAVDYKGENRKVVAQQTRMLREPIAMTVFENHAYVVNRLSSLLTRCKLYGNMECHQIDMRANNMKRIVVAQQSTQRMDINHCEDHTCDVLCIPVDLKYKCLCSNGTFVGRNGNCGETTSLTQKSSSVWWWTFLLFIAVLSTAATAIFMYRRRGSHGKFNVSMYFKNNELCRVLPQDVKPTPFPRTTTSATLASAPTVNTLNRDCHEIINDDYSKHYNSATTLNMNTTEVNAFSDDEPEDMNDVDFSNDPHQRLIL